MSRSLFAFCLLVCVFPATCYSPAQGQETNVFSLTANRQYEDQLPAEQHPRNGDLAYREFIRQGLLLSAREEFGLATRDETLMETVDRDSPKTFDVVVAAKLYHGLNFQVSREGKPLLDLYIRDMLEDAKAYNVIATAVESQSRNEYAKMLEEAGYKRQPNPWHASAELPEGVEDLLCQMNDICQYRALRAIHRAIRESGESPERLGGLVRGYSNLAQLTIRGIDCRGFAFRCRAWLYAERLRQKTDQSALSDWHWGYMAVMAGLPTPAKEAITRAKANAKPELPAWGDLIENYCNYRYNELATLTDSNDRYSELATVLCVRVIQQFNSKVAMLEAGKHALEQVPECLWIHEQMYQAAGVSFKHRLVRMGPHLLSGELTTQLPLFSELPPAVEQLLAKNDALDQLEVAAVAAAIATAGQEDRHEPSLEVLGRNIEAFNMLHIFRLANFQKATLGSDAQQYVDYITPAAESHPLFPLLQTYRFSRSHRLGKFQPLMKNYVFKDGNPFTGYRFYSPLPSKLQLANMPLSEARDLCWYGQMDDEEFIAMDAMRVNKIHSTTLARMKSISLDSPLRLGAQIRYHYDQMKDQEQEWLEKYGHYPSIHSALGVVYEEKGEYEKAAEHLKIAANKVSDYNVLDRLASVYYKLKDERWLSTIASVLDREDNGLEHSKANRAIASTLMSEGKFEKALTYAEQGAHSGAQWAYETYLDCLTGLGKWDEAEQIAQRSGSRYRGSTWFDWCAETGHGDLEAAWQAEQQRLSRYKASGDRTIDVQTVIYLISAGQKQQALDFVTKKLDEELTPWNCMHQALLADELGDTALRDQALKKITTFQPKDAAHWNPYQYLAITMQTALQEDRALTMSDAKAIFANRGDYKKWVNSLRYFVGNYNLLHAKGDEKTSELKATARLPFFGGWVRTLAWVRLRNNGIDPIQLEDRQFKKQYTIPAE